MKQLKPSDQSATAQHQTNITQEVTASVTQQTNLIVIEVHHNQRKLRLNVIRQILLWTDPLPTHSDSDGELLSPPAAVNISVINNKTNLSY